MNLASSAPSVHVIVVNYNGWQHAEKCLASLARSEYPALRVLVVDNGSTDGSVARLRERFPELDILEIEHNVGFTAANNAGARRALAARPDYLWFLNNDTTVDSRALCELVAVAEADAGVGAAASVLYHMRDPNAVQAWGGGFVRLWGGTADMYLAPVPAARLHFLAGTSLLVRRAAIERVGLLDERYFMYWEDTDFCFRLRGAGWRLAVADRSKVWHYGSASMGENTRAQKSPEFELRFTQSAVRFFRQYAPIPPVPLVAGIGVHLAKRVLRGQWPRARAIVRGGLAALRGTSRARPKKVV